jgi:hypothetical protein
LTSGGLTFVLGGAVVIVGNAGEKLQKVEKRGH